MFSSKFFAWYVYLFRNTNRLTHSAVETLPPDVCSHLVIYEGLAGLGAARDVRKFGGRIST